MAKIYIGFTSPNQSLWDKYVRHGEGQLMVADRADYAIFAKIYDGYLDGGMHVLPTAPDTNWWLRLCRVETGSYVDVATGPVYKAGTVPPPYSGLVGDGHYITGEVGPDGKFIQAGFVCKWTIKRGQFPDGNYEVTSSIPGTMGFTLQISNSLVVIPPSRYIVQRPTYMPQAGGFPNSTLTKIVEFKGVRTLDTSAPVPFTDAGVFTKPFIHNQNTSELWSESFGTNIPDYDGLAWPSTSPLGGLHYVAKQRYTINDYASVVPDIDGNSNAPKADAVYDHSPSERLDGGPGTGGAGVVPSGFRNADGYIYILATTGSIIRIDPATRAMKTVYGWVRKPGTPQPVASALLPRGVDRVNWLKQFFDFIGTGPTISRAWQMCRDVTDDMIVYVADATNHTVVMVDMRKSIGSVIAGTSGIAGWADGAMGVAKFDQPRGICMLKSGTYAGKLVVADEHNSAYRLVDPVTGITSTLSRAKKVPTRFPGDFVNELSRKTNRLVWGAPTNPDGTIAFAGKVQPFIDAQFCHPCHLAVLSDGKTVVAVHHDEYRGFRLDLDAKTITHLFDIEAAATRSDVSPKNWPTVHADLTGSMGYGIDTLWVCSWHYNNQDVYSPDGKRVFSDWISWGTCGDHPGLRHNAYSRAMIVLGDGSFIFNGDGQNSLCRVRKMLPSDPKIDRARLSRGSAIYRADGVSRASLLTTNGSVGVNYLAQLKTPGELAMMLFADRKKYMVDTFGVTDWSDTDHADVAYYLDANCPLGVHLRRGAPIPPVTMTFDAALAQVRAGAAHRRSGAAIILTPQDVAATDWIKRL